MNRGPSLLLVPEMIGNSGNRYKLDHRSIITVNELLRSLICYSNMSLAVDDVSISAVSADIF